MTIFSFYFTASKHRLTRKLQLLREVETQAIAAQQQISLVRTQQASKQREMRMAQLTRTELSTLPTDTNVFEGVGKMFGSPPLSSISPSAQLMITPIKHLGTIERG